MATLAIALLRIPDLDTQGRARVVKLDDAVLVHTGLDFGSEPEVILDAVLAAAGDAFDDHEDERGVLVIPAVARPTTKTYEAIVAEVGELGMWIDPDEIEDAADAAEAARELAMNPSAGAFGLGAFGGPALEGLVGQMMGALGPGGLEELQRAMASGDPQSIARVQSMMSNAMAQIGDPEEIARTLGAALGGMGDDAGLDDEDDLDGEGDEDADADGAGTSDGSGAPAAGSAKTPGGAARKS